MNSKRLTVDNRLIVKNDITSPKETSESCRPLSSRITCRNGCFNINPGATTGHAKQHRYLPGTRRFSSSNQLTTMLILRGVSGATGLPVDPASFIIRNRLPSGWMSQGVKSLVLVRPSKEKSFAADLCA